MTPPSAIDRAESPRAAAAAKVVMFEPIAAELARVDEIFAAELASRYPFVNSLAEQVAGYRGKQLRPALLLLSAKAVGEMREEHLVLAAVVEMIHTATLVHDDVLDDAVVRRHKATVNAEWGVETSVLLGDYLFTHAFHLAAGTGSTLACRLIGRATNIVCEGELHQVHDRGNLELTEAEYFDIINGKTAELTALSCQLGAHYAGAPAALEESLARYGRSLGMAFQIADDLLDLLGEERDTGKSLGTDLDKQKLTLPLIWLLQHGPSDEVRAARRLLDDSPADKRAELRPILEKSGALRYARTQAQRFATSARDELASLPDSPATRMLVNVTEFVVSRST